MTNFSLILKSLWPLADNSPKLIICLWKLTQRPVAAGPKYGPWICSIITIIQELLEIRNLRTHHWSWICILTRPQVVLCTLKSKEHYPPVSELYLLRGPWCSNPVWLPRALIIECILQSFWSKSIFLSEHLQCLAFTMHSISLLFAKFSA